MHFLPCYIKVEKLKVLKVLQFTQGRLNDSLDKIPKAGVKMKNIWMQLALGVLIFFW